MTLEVDIGPNLAWGPIVLKCGVKGTVLVFIMVRIKPLIQILLRQERVKIERIVSCALDSC